MSGPGGDASYATGHSRTSNGGNSRATSRQHSMTGNNQYPAPQYGNQDDQYVSAPAPAQEPNRNQNFSSEYAPNQGYATSDVVHESRGRNSNQPGFSSGKTDSAIQLGAYPQGMAGGNPAYLMPSPAQYGQRYGESDAQQGNRPQGPLGQGAQQPQSHVQYPAVLYNQQHQNYAQHDPHTMVRNRNCYALHHISSSSLRMITDAFTLHRSMLLFVCIMWEFGATKFTHTAPCKGIYVVMTV